MKTLLPLFIVLLLASTGWAQPLPLEGLLNKNPRIIIFSPHPDDDVLSSSGVMTAILAMQSHGLTADLRVVYMTCGDGYDKALEITKQKGTASTYVELGQLRHKEALAALKKVGVPAQKAIFLGFPDGGMDSIFAMADTAAEPYSGGHTEMSSVPYNFAAHPGQLYLKSSVLSDIKNIIEEFNPTVVFTPTLTDQHHDHWATRQFVTEVLQKMQSPPLHLEYLIHWEKTDGGWPKTTVDWQTPKNHVPAEYSLSIGDYNYSINDKRAVIGFHQSQVDVDGDYLLNFSKATEIYWMTKQKIEDYLTSRTELAY